MRCATSVTGSSPSGEPTSPRRTGRKDRWACRPGRTNSSAKWSACCWRRTTSHGSPTGHTGTDPIVAATPHCRRYRITGRARPGSSKEMSQTASDRLTTTSCYPRSRKASTTAGSSGCCVTCSKPGTWRTGYGTRHCPAPRKAVSHPRSSPIFIWTGWTSSSRKFSSQNTPEERPGYPTLTTKRRTD
jgi:hypothetical protein